MIKVEVWHAGAEAESDTRTLSFAELGPGHPTLVWLWDDLLWTWEFTLPEYAGLIRRLTHFGQAGWRRPGSPYALVYTFPDCVYLVPIGEGPCMPFRFSNSLFVKKLIGHYDQIERAMRSHDH